MTDSDANEIVSNLRVLLDEHGGLDNEIMEYLLNNLYPILDALELGIKANNVIQSRKSTSDTFEYLLHAIGSGVAVDEWRAQYEDAKIAQKLALEAYNELTGENIIYV